MCNNGRIVESSHGCHKQWSNVTTPCGVNDYFPRPAPPPQVRHDISAENATVDDLLMSLVRRPSHAMCDDTEMACRVMVPKAS